MNNVIRFFSFFSSGIKTKNTTAIPVSSLGPVAVSSGGVVLPRPLPGA